MNEDEDLVLNAKAIGLAVGGAALAGMLFVLTRRDERPAPAVETSVEEPVADDFANAAREAASEARSHRETVEEASKDNGRPQDAGTSSSADIAALEHDLKAAWDAQERARFAESKFHAASSKVAEDVADEASRVAGEARHLAGEGKGRISRFRRPGRSDSDVERLNGEEDARRENIADRTKANSKDPLGVKQKLAGKRVGPLPEGVVGEAASAALESLEKSLKTKAPLLLAARNKAQAMEILQRELGPILRDSALLALSTAVGSAERASQKTVSAPQDFKQRFRQQAEAEAQVDAADIEDDVRAAHEAATAELLKARDEAEAEARAARAEAERLKDELAAKLEVLKQGGAGEGHHSLWERPVAEPVAEPEVAVAPHLEVATDATQEEETSGKRGVSGLLWGGAGLGLAIYAMMDPARRESILKMANEASVQMQELVRDLQGYDDEF